MNAGQNWQAALLTGGSAAGKTVYIALGAGAGAPSATDTSLAGGELNSGLQRVAAQATLIGAAAAGTVTYTLINTFTYTGASQQTNVNVAGLFTTTGANSPTMWAETTFADFVSHMIS